MQCGGFRERACFGKRHSLSDLLIHVVLELFEIRIRTEVVVAHRPLEQN